MNSNELIKFKEELLTRLKENETRINEIQKTNKNEIDKKMNLYEKKIEETNMRLNDMHNITITQKEKIEKVNELMKYKQNSSDQLFTLELKTGNLEKELSNACNKYDRHYLDNMVLPGTIGDYCKYKNLKEYLEVYLSYFAYNYIIYC